MIVCLCHGVPDRVIDQAIAGGASTVKEIGLACGAGMGCGACRCVLIQKLSRQKGASGGAARQPCDSVAPTG